MNTSGNKTPTTFNPGRLLINKDLFSSSSLHNTILQPENTFTIVHDL